MRAATLLPIVLALAPAAAAQSPARRGTAPADTHVVHVVVGPSGYAPAEVRLWPGVPNRLVFTRTTDRGCGGRVQIPAFGVGPTALPLNRPVAITVTPRAPGRYAFACAMNMLKGTLVVALR